MLVFAADHAYCEAHGIDIDVMLAVIDVFGEDRCGVRDAAEAPADAAAASQPGMNRTSAPMVRVIKKWKEAFWYWTLVMSLPPRSISRAVSGLIRAPATPPRLPSSSPSTMRLRPN
jgi:hypothetical protein